MPSGNRNVKLSLDIDPSVHAEEQEQLARSLRNEILELSVDNVAAEDSQELPAGAKAGVAIDWSTLIITLAASGGVLTALTSLIQSWLGRQGQSKVCVEIDGDKLEISGTPSDEQKRLIDAWLQRHRGFVICDS